MDYGGLVEYLLAKKIGGRRLVNFGGNITRIDTFPPRWMLPFGITNTVGPRFGAYANIQYWGSFGPGMVPDAFWYDSRQMGMTMESGWLSDIIIGRNSIWAELTVNAPFRTTIINMTNVLQYLEVGNSYLIVYTAEDLDIVHELIDEWCYMKSVRNVLEEQKQILEQIRDK